MNGWTCPICGRWHPNSHKHCFFCVNDAKKLNRKQKEKKMSEDLLKERLKIATAHAAGTLIECFNGLTGSWEPVVCSTPCFDDMSTKFRVFDAHRELKNAHAAGKTIQIEDVPGGAWVDLPNPTWVYRPEFYRIKPDPEKVLLKSDIKGFHCGPSCEHFHSMDDYLEMEDVYSFILK